MRVDAHRRAIMELIWEGMHEGLPRPKEERLRDLMEQHNPSAHRLSSEELLEAGRILVGTWVLEEAIEKAVAAEG